MLCVEWQAKVAPIPCKYPIPLSWGPSEEELHNAAAEKYTPKLDNRLNEGSVDDEQYNRDSECEDESTSDNNWESDAEEEEDELVELMEMVGFADEYKTRNDVLQYADDDGLSMTEDDSESHGYGSSPRKRQRFLTRDLV
jgi:hypothetical protein